MSFNGDLYPTAGADVVMTTSGDMVKYESGARARLGIGSANQILQVKSSLPSWETLSTAGSILTTQGDVLIEGASGLERLGFGTSGYFLTTNGTGANPTWTAGGVGDMLLGTAQNITAAKTFNDSIKCYFGTGDDASLDYDGTNFLINPRAVGSGSALMENGAFWFKKETNQDIASGVITATTNYSAVGTEGGASTDDLDTINAPIQRSGLLFMLTDNNNSRDVTVKDAVDNLQIAGDFTLSSTADTMLLGIGVTVSEFNEWSRSDNA